LKKADIVTYLGGTSLEEEGRTRGKGKGKRFLKLGRSSEDKFFRQKLKEVGAKERGGGGAADLLHRGNMGRELREEKKRRPRFLIISSIRAPMEGKGAE